jgi:hypothetical protein
MAAIYNLGEHVKLAVGDTQPTHNKTAANEVSPNHFCVLWT